MTSRRQPNRKDRNSKVAHVLRHLYFITEVHLEPPWAGMRCFCSLRGFGKTHLAIGVQLVDDVAFDQENAGWPTTK